MLLSESQLAELTQRDRKTVRAKLMEVPYEDGPRNAKLYESHIALGVLYGVGADYKKGVVTPQEAARRLTLKRTEEIDLNMEVTRRERIPLEDVEEHNEQVLGNIAGIFKANEGKQLSPELIQELFAELRRMDEVLNKFCRKSVRADVPEPPEPEPETWEDDPLFN